MRHPMKPEENPNDRLCKMALASRLRTKKELCDILQVSTSTLRRRIRKADITTERSLMDPRKQAEILAAFGYRAVWQDS